MNSAHLDRIADQFAAALLPREPVPLSRWAEEHYRLSSESSARAGTSSGGKAAAKPEEDKKEEPRKRGFGLNALKGGTSQEKQSTQVSASGGARGLGADRMAKGGSNPALVRVAVTNAEVEAFRKGIA